MDHCDIGFVGSTFPSEQQTSDSDLERKAIRGRDRRTQNRTPICFPVGHYRLGCRRAAFRFSTTSAFCQRLKLSSSRRYASRWPWMGFQGLMGISNNPVGY